MCVCVWVCVVKQPKKVPKVGVRLLYRLVDDTRFRRDQGSDLTPPGTFLSCTGVEVFCVRLLTPPTVHLRWFRRSDISLWFFLFN